MSKIVTVEDKWVRKFIVDLNERWHLDEGQGLVVRDIFREGCKIGAWQAGRKRGKTTIELYSLCRAAGTKAGSILYWFAPRAKQAREIIWSSNRLQTFLPKKYIKKVLSVEMRLILFNDSFIKLDGSDEYEQYRGVEADGACYDEMKDFDYRFDTAFRPNLGPRRGFLFAAGTPPRNKASASERGYFAFIEECKYREDGFFYEAPSWGRPDREWQEELGRIEAGYKHKAVDDPDQWDEWLCEYGGRYVEGGPGAIIPQFKAEKHVVGHQQMLTDLYPRTNEVDYFAIADPGTNHAFAVLFCAVDKEQSRVYILDEIYETDQKENTTNRIYPRILDAISEFYPYPDLWGLRYDEAALWFKAHIGTSHYDHGWMPTSKWRYRDSRPNEVKPYLDMIKDCFREDCILISDRCENLIRELKIYKRDEKGNIPKKNDDCIDCLRYLMGESMFSFVPKANERQGNLMPRRLMPAGDEQELFQTNEMLGAMLNIPWEF
jgi:hypothetical protein